MRNRCAVSSPRALDVSAADIVIGNGSEEMIAAAARSFLTGGAEALTVAPCFGLHEIEALAVGAEGRRRSR